MTVSSEKGERRTEIQNWVKEVHEEFKILEVQISRLFEVSFSELFCFEELGRQ